MLPQDPFGLTEYAAERFGLVPNEIAHIEAKVDARDAPLLVVTLFAAPKVNRPPT